MHYNDERRVLDSRRDCDCDERRRSPRGELQAKWKPRIVASDDISSVE